MFNLILPTSRHEVAMTIIGGDGGNRSDLGGEQ